MKCTEIAYLQDLQNVIDTSRKYGMLSGEQLTDSREVELSEKKRWRLLRILKTGFLRNTSVSNFEYNQIFGLAGC